MPLVVAQVGALVGALSVSGCEPTAQNTPQSLASERAQSQQLVRQLQSQDALVEDPALNAYFRQVVERIERTRPPGSVPIEAFIVKDADVNAFTPGGGYLFANAGLIAAMENEAQLATVIAHEIGHIDRGHIQAGQATRTGVQLGAAAAMIGGALLGVDPNLTELGVGLGANLAVSSFTRTQERDADATGIQYVAAAGYDGDEGARSFEVLRRLYGDAGVPWLNSHPPSGERQEAVAQTAAQLGATEGYVGQAEYDRATRELRQAVLQYYEQSGRTREAAQIRQNLRG
jgi:predicted Zn-dependent protease